MVKLCTVLLAGGMSPDGERIVSEETVVSPTTRQHEGLLDETFGIDLTPGPAELLIHHRADRQRLACPVVRFHEISRCP